MAWAMATGIASQPSAVNCTKHHDEIPSFSIVTGSAARWASREAARADARTLVLTSTKVHPAGSASLSAICPYSEVRVALNEAWAYDEVGYAATSIITTVSTPVATGEEAGWGLTSVAACCAP